MEIAAANALGTTPFRNPASGWRASLIVVAAVISLPVLVIVASLTEPYSEVWQHLFSTVLRDYISNSLLLMLGVGMGTFCLGVSGAWLTAMCNFPGRRFFSWALLLPMAMPAYIIAYTYTGLLDFTGPLQTALREYLELGYGDYWFPEIRSLGGAVVMLSLVLYPYVYLLARVAFSEQSTAVLEASRNLGRGPWQTLFQVGLPLARPAIVAGLSLALMETLADYGTVEYFGVSTFTTGIFRTWYGLGELTAAAQLSAALMLFVFVLIVMERWSRNRMRFHHSTSRARPTRINLSGWRAALSVSLVGSTVLFGFFLPASQLALWALSNWHSSFNASFLDLILNSFLLAASAALCCLFIALLLGYGKRLHPGKLENGTVRLSSMGYAVPGTVIAVGVLIPFAWFDNQLDEFLRNHFDFSSGLLLSGTLGALIFAYVVRFLSVSLQSVEAGLIKIRPAIDESAPVAGPIAFGGAATNSFADTARQFANRPAAGICRRVKGITHHTHSAPFQLQYPGSANV